jgi:K+-sensing histidine kinase KdpD
VSESSTGDQSLTKEQIEQLRQTQRAMETFIAEVSSEARTPASAILGYSELMLMEKVGPLSDNQRNILTNIKTSSEFLLKVWGELFLASRALIDGLFKHKVDLEQVIREAILAALQYYHLVHSRAELIIENRIPNGLPNVQGDASLLQQAITWLILDWVNLPVRKTYGEQEIIELSASYDNQEVTITVNPKNDPIQNDREDSPRFFLSRMIIEKHGGRVVKDDIEVSSSLVLPIGET